MKIILVTHYYPAHGGGVEIVAGEIAARLVREHGIEITWCASDADPHPNNITGLACIPMKTCNFSERFFGIPYPFWGAASLNKMRKAIRDSDIVHLHEYAYFGNIAAYIFSRMYKKPVIITQHIGYVPYKNLFFVTLLSFMNRWMGSRILTGAEQVIFISETTGNYFSRFSRFKRQPQFIQNGVNTVTFFPVGEPQRAVIRDRIKVAKETPLFVFVGRFVEKKGLPILKALAEHFKNVQWVFIGWGPIDPERWNLSNVRVYRHLEQAEVAQFYQTADLLILPSKGEGFPLVIQEAMACGTPVIVGTETAGACSAAEPLMFHESVEGENVVSRWAARIDDLLQDRALLTELMPKLAAFAHEHWSWQRCVEEYYGVFQRSIPVSKEPTQKAMP